MTGQHAHAKVESVPAALWRTYIVLRLGPPGLSKRRAHRQVRRIAARRGLHWPELRDVKVIEDHHGLGRDMHTDAERNRRRVA